jgi:hypothetical protein
MIKIQLFAAILLFIVNLNALHISDKIHLAYDNTDDYLQGLKDQQSKF